MHRPALCAVVIVRTATTPPFPSTPMPSTPSAHSHMFPFPPPPPPTFTPFAPLSLSLPLPGLSLPDADDLSFRKDARIALSRAAFNSRR